MGTRDEKERPASLLRLFALQMTELKSRMV